MELNSFLLLAEGKMSAISRQELIRNPDFFQKPKGIAPQMHAKIIDGILGFHISKVEQKLVRKHRNYDKNFSDKRKDEYQEHHTWIGLNPQVLLTPYCDFVEILNQLPLNEIKSVVDFGAAYGRLGIVMASMVSKATFLGYEIVEKRIDEGMRLFNHLQLDSARIVHQDITDDNFSIPEADAYFVYDFGNTDDLKIILNKLLKVAETRSIRLIARGEFLREIIDSRYPSLRSSFAPIHGKFWTIYQTELIVSSK